MDERDADEVGLGRGLLQHELSACDEAGFLLDEGECLVVHLHRIHREEVLLRLLILEQVVDPVPDLLIDRSVVLDVLRPDSSRRLAARQQRDLVPHVRVPFFCT